jgi:hypothetical protein
VIVSTLTTLVFTDVFARRLARERQSQCQSG